MNKTINVTEYFRIIQESSQYSLQQLVTIDPANSPKYDPKKHGTELRQEWKNCDGYYGLNATGLESIIKAIIIKEAGINGKEVSLGEYLNELREISGIVHKAVECLH
jgi:hypothetical protein